MMNRRLGMLLVLAAMVTGIVCPAFADNTYQDKFENYQVQSMGNNVLRFTIPVWVYGKSGGDRTYFLEAHTKANDNYEDNYIWYSEKNGQGRGSADVHRIASFGAPASTNYEGYKANGVGYAYVLAQTGSIIVTNTYNGNPLTMVEGDTSHWVINGDNPHNDRTRIEVTRMNTYYTNYAVFLQMDWYMPEKLQGKEFYVGLNIHKYRVGDYESFNHHWWQWDTKYQGGDLPQSPELYEPFFYADANKPHIQGKAGIVYVTYQDPKSYHINLNPSNEVRTYKRSEVFYVQMQDSVIPHLNAEFVVWIDSAAQLSQRLTSNTIYVPAYHKARNFKGDGYKYQDANTGKWFIDYRYKQLSWEIHYPDHQDMIDGDAFELQRAYHADFSDAQTIDLIPLEYDSLTTDTVTQIQTYTYVDSVKAAWWNPVENSYQIYYRIRRASSSTWGWDNNQYASTLAYLPPQEYSPFIYAKDIHYSLAADFATSRQVDLSLALPNKNMNPARSEAEPGFCYYYYDPMQRFILRKILTELEDTVEVDIPQENILKAIDDVRLNADNDAYMKSALTIRYTETALTPCVHYKYEVYIDTTDVTVYRPDKDYPTPRPVKPASESDSIVYFTEAANINTFAGSHQEYSDYVLLTWEPTDGEVGSYTIDTRPNDTAEWKTLATGLKNSWYKDTYADPEIAAEWQYRLTMTYVCNGNTKTASAKTTGGRNPYGKISGRVTYSDGTGCANLTVTATHVDADTAVQKVLTDENGYYLLDSVRYGGDAQYVVTPVHPKAKFTYNGIESPANITLSLDRCIASNVNFTNISSVRMTGRVLYDNTTIPVRDANFLLDGALVKTNGNPYKTDASGNFDFYVPKGIEFTLQAVKDGHWFKGDGYVYVEGDNRITIEEPLPAVRIYDQTRVRLIGRLAGGNNQASLPLGHGLSTNYLGDDLKMVFELEGDNISQIVHFQDDESIKEVTDTVETTAVLFEKKRITIKPDVLTGEYAVDLFPVKYKIIQATANGYSTLFAKGKTTETLDLVNAPMTHGEDIYEEDTVRYNEKYSITYHSPISVTCKQLKYGREQEFYGEETMRRQNIHNEKIEVPLVEKQADGTYTYLFGAPVFSMGYYEFRITAHEDYYYNNDLTSPRHEEVRIKGGELTAYNGLYDAPSTEVQTALLDTLGQADIRIPVNYVSFVKTGEDALRVLDLSVEYEGDYVQSQAIRAYVSGDKAKGKEFTASTHGDVILLDILRDPPGSSSSAYIESGATYSYDYNMNLDFTFGVDIELGYGTNVNYTMGSWAGVGGGVFVGTPINLSNVIKTSLPITLEFIYKHNGTYSFSTSERISTSTDGVGTPADVYIGACQSVVYGLTDAVKPLDSLTYVTLAARAANGSMRTVAEGRDADGNKYYLVIGTEIGAETHIKSTFVYTDEYITNTLLAQLRQRRDQLLMTGDSATVAAIMEATGEPVYWSMVEPDDDNFAMPGYYRLIHPNDDKMYDDEVASYNREIADWVELLVLNETEKLAAKRGSLGKKLGTWSIGGATSVSHSESYSYSNSYSKELLFPGLSGSIPGVDLTALKSLLNKNLLQKLQNAYADVSDAEDPFDLIASSGNAKWTFSLTPIANVDWNRSPDTWTEGNSKSTGFSLSGDNAAHSSMNVTVYRIENKDSGFNDESDGTRDYADATNNGADDHLFGSYVYFLNGGATRCPWQGPDSTRFMKQKMELSGGTLKLENPKLDINVHERSNVPADQAAVFNLRLTNEGEMPYGEGLAPIPFTLKLVDQSNPLGAKIMIDGMPLTTEGRPVSLSRGQILNKTLEVYAGEGYDFENISLSLASTCDPGAKTNCTFSVHYMPVACPVNISAPHDKWIMNTLSPQDSAGWYLPVVIEGFDVNYKGFDHIEFQYKLTTESDEAWVNLCSYYADEELYNQASGNKAMMNAGRIENIRFYGERDPMEQQYDLRAVAFCRHGNSYITRNSAVLTGVKDTRVPRVFGTPEPADAILSVGDNLLLRFNEPIAGNYLDEDNNFQVLGVINASDVFTQTAINFAGSIDSYAVSEVKRSLAYKSFTLDMMVKPANPDKDEIFFMHGNTGKGLVFGKTADNRLFLRFGMLGTQVTSDTIPTRMTSFQRVMASYNHETGNVRFYAGSLDVTDPNQTPVIPEYKERGVFFFGYTYAGSILEARVWTKALSTAEILNTDGYLTGYEHELLAYYPMNEGKGETLTDKANGADLYAHGISWSKSKGISLAVNATDSVELAGDLIARNAVQDATYMFWFRTSQAKGRIFQAPAAKFSLGFEGGNLVLGSEDKQWSLGSGWADNSWHHFVLCISRTYNNVAVYIDDQLLQHLSAKNFGSVSGRMFFGGSGFAGHVDELAVFEQALPKTLVENYGISSPHGDEMGLVGYLSFEEMKENESGIMELVFSINDHREIIENGKVIEMHDPLVINDIATLTGDKENYAPVATAPHLSKLSFDWSFNNDELLINLKMLDKEINKQSVYITVRDVEDLNGNPMTSPVTWTAFVDRNALKWAKRETSVEAVYGETLSPITRSVRILNNSGKRHQFEITSLPDWLTIDLTRGSLEPTEELTLTFSFNPDMAPGDYGDIIYLSDESGLNEPMRVEMNVVAEPPYDGVDRTKYPYNSVICGEVFIDEAYDMDENDIVYAFYRNDCLGKANIEIDSERNTSSVFLTVYGNDSIEREEITCKLWQASSARLFMLVPNRELMYSVNTTVGCGDELPVRFTVSGSETQTISVEQGWNWISTNLKFLNDSLAGANVAMTASAPWTEGDVIKTPGESQFSSYSDSAAAFVGTFEKWDHTQLYMVYSANGNTMYISGEPLDNADKKISLRGDGQWNILPCYLDEVTPIAQALADYYDYATPGDIVKNYDHFAIFSQNKRWEGDLKTLRPGEGYFMYRRAVGTVSFNFYTVPSNAPAKTNSLPFREESEVGSLNARRYPTNMTMVARIEGMNELTNERVNAYIGDELVGVASPVLTTNDERPTTNDEALYFLTISSNAMGSAIRFETEDGVVLQPVSLSTGEGRGEALLYQPNAHHGTLKAPVILTTNEALTGPTTYKLIENDQVIIIRDGKTYNVLGQPVNR